jgi:hypothetical protein
MRNVPKGLMHVKNLIESLAEILPFNEESIQEHAKKFNIEDIQKDK